MAARIDANMRKDFVVVVRRVVCYTKCAQSVVIGGGDGGGEFFELVFWRVPTATASAASTLRSPDRRPTIAAAVDAAVASISHAHASNERANKRERGERNRQQLFFVRRLSPSAFAHRRDTCCRRRNGKQTSSAR